MAENGAEITSLSDGSRLSFSNRRSCDRYKFVGDQAGAANQDAINARSTQQCSSIVRHDAAPYWIETASPRPCRISDPSVPVVGSAGEHPGSGDPDLSQLCSAACGEEPLCGRARLSGSYHRQMVCNSKLIGSQAGYPGNLNALGVVTGLQADLR